MTEWFEQADWWPIIWIAVFLNVATIVSSWALWTYWQRSRPNLIVRAPSGRDCALTLLTIVVNTAGNIAAFWLWRRGWISLGDFSLWRSLAGAVYLVAAVDVIMYFVHRTFHMGVLYDWFHSVHHRQDMPTSSLTLFVMHPAEAAGFSLLALTLMWIWPVPIVSLALFFGVNLVMGTAAHTPRGDDAPRWWDPYLGGSIAHQAHHLEPDTNFAFFTRLLDHLFGTVERSPTKPVAPARR